MYLSAATAKNILRDAVNVPGSIRANSVGMRNCRIVIGGGPGGKVTITGHLSANGGRKHQGGTIAIAGAAVTTKGRITANGTQGGTVTITATNELQVSGPISAKGSQALGGRIDLTGANVTLLGALIDASGAADSEKSGRLRHSHTSSPNAATSPRPT